MRVLFTVFPSVSHLFPVVPLARALRTAGHEVCVAAHDGIAESDMAAAITATGLTAVRLGPREELREMVAAHRSDDSSRAREALALDPLGETGWEPVRDVLLGMFSNYYPTRPGPEPWPMLDALVGFARSWRPDLVLWDPLCPPAAIAAHACGAAHGRLLWGLDNIGWISQAQAPGDDRFAEWMRPLLRRYGQDYSPEALLGQWSVDLLPPRMRLPVEGRSLSVRRVPYAGAVTLPPWLHEPPSRPRVVLTLGMSARKEPEGNSGLPLGDVLDAAAGRDIELVATLDPGQLPARELPDNVRAVGYMPLDVLLPGASAVVHHGGGGTFAAAVAHRVPHVIVPVPKWDERATARYVRERGAGAVLARDGLSVDELYRQIERVLKDSSCQEGATALHHESLALPGPPETAVLLERLTAEHRRGGIRCGSSS
ncbi:nucleotide disphospho-sugar-binding domain-containing protein [Streptomyces sp. NPDC055189]